jgi:hypothetical protein
MNNDRLTQIIKAAAEDLVALADEHQDDILSGIHKITTEAQMHDQEKVKVKLNYSITLDLGNNSQKHVLGWTVAHKVEAERRLPNPDGSVDQDLPFGDDDQQ